MGSSCGGVFLLLVLMGVLAGGCGERTGCPWESVGEKAARISEERLAARSAEPLGSAERDETLLLSSVAGQSSDEAGSSGARAAGGGERVERGPRPGFSETVVRDLKLFPRSVWEDTKEVYTDPLNWIVLLSAGGASLALRPEVDDDIEDSLRGKDIFKDDWNDAFGAMGNPGTHFAMAGMWYLAGQQMQDTKTYEVGRTLFNALAINGASTMLLKAAAWTDAPNGEWGGWPSGHVSSTVTLAAVLEEAYGPLVGIPLYGLAGLVAVERLDDEEHHFSDVVFGAVLGYVIGKTVAKGHRPEMFGGEIVPYADPAGGSSGLLWVKTFR